jgi:CRP-like cAMP-binding protein
VFFFVASKQTSQQGKDCGKEDLLTMASRPVLKKQESLSEAPHASKAEFESFFGFVESHYQLIERAMDSVSYSPGILSIHSHADNATVETMKSSIANAIASEKKIPPRVRDSILHFFVEPPVMSSPNSNNKISVHHGSNRLENLLVELAPGSTSRMMIAVSKITYVISFWETADTATELEDDPSEYRFEVRVSRQNGETAGLSTWDFTLSGSIEIRQVDPALYTKLESEFDKHFHAEQSFTPSAITALSKPRDAIYDTVNISDNYQPIIYPKPEEVCDILMKVVKSNVLFKSYTSDEQKAIVGAFQPFDVGAHEVVIRQGDEGAYFYVVGEGSLEILLDADGLEVQIGRTLAKGDYFGELALLYNTPRAATVRSLTPCTLWRIDRPTYRCIVTYFHNLALAEHTEFLKNVQLHGNRLGDILKPSDVDKVVTHLETEEFTDGSVIIRQGNTGDSFFIIKSGDVAVWQQQLQDGKAVWVQLTTLHKGQFFGEKALLNDDVRQASCIALGDVSVLSLNRHDFIEMLGSWKDIIAAAAASGNVDAPISTTRDHKNFMKTMVLEDLQVLRTLGQGAFGRVKLCQHKISGETFALKCQSKKVQKIIHLSP